MEDDNGLELSLGLSCGGSLGKPKSKDTSSDPKVDEGSSDRLLVGNMTATDPAFKNFFQTANENHDQKGKQKSTVDLQQHENFWTDLGKSSVPVADHPNDVKDGFPQFNGYQDLFSKNEKTTYTEEEKSNKRKMPFEDTNIQNKHDKVVDYADLHGHHACLNLTRNSHVSITEDACSGVNEDVAESEAEGSNSWLVSQYEEKSKSSDISKLSEKNVVIDSSGIGSHGSKELPVSGSESNHEPGKVAYGIPLVQPPTVMPIPYPVPIMVPTDANAPSTTRFSSSCTMKPLPAINIDCTAGQTINPSNLQLSFGYSLVQLPTLETGSSWAFSSQPGQPSSFPRDGASNAQNSGGTKQGPDHASSAGTLHEKSSELVKGDANRVGEIGSSSQDEHQSKGTFPFFRQKDKTSQAVAAGLPHEGPTIRPGIASEVKFGGSGSYPELPWVSTTGPGASGKTISGVTYKYNQNEVRIVCACHGIHMTPEKFVQHASADAPSPESNTALSSLPSSNPAASAKS